MAAWIFLFVWTSLGFASEPGAAKAAPRAKAAPAAKAAPKAVAEKGGIEWVSIPGGSFMMGSTGKFAEEDEKPVHRVTVKAFQLAKTEVTNKQYQACVEAEACTMRTSVRGGDNDPAVFVEWAEAKKFSEWVGGRLPTEAEWAYAAQSAGKGHVYPWGNEEATCAKARIAGCGDGAAPVCSTPAGNTAQGLCDMAGNVWEWTQDWYHDSYQGAPTDGSAWDSPAGAFRVLRGGSWNFIAAFSRSASRHNYDPAHGSVFVGFRPAR